MENKFALPALIGMGLLLAGCGGGGSGGNSSAGSGGTTPTGASQTISVGNASITYQGQPKATVTATGSSVTSFGVAGANISQLTYYPTNNLADTNVLYADNGDIYSYSLRTFTTTDITPNFTDSGWPSCSNTGIVAFTRLDSTNQVQIWTVKLDGSSLTQVTKGTTYYASVSISPNGLQFAASDLSGNLYRISNAGVATEILPHGTGGSYLQPFYGTSWSPDGSKIAFYGSGNNLYTVPSGGGTPTLVYTGTQVEFPSWSPDGSQLIASSGTEILGISVTQGASQSPPVLAGSSSAGEVAAAFSPDGKKIAYVQTSPSKGLFTCDPNGNNQTYVAAVTSPNPWGIVWTSFLPVENLLGTGGQVTTNIESGVVVTNGTKGFGSLLAFKANTPSTAVVVGENSTNGPIGFTISADSITSVSWINSYYGPSTTKTLTSTPQLLFGVDGTMGAVSFVAPALTQRASGFSRVKRGSSVVYSGRFTSVFDAQGNNVAPGGASSITVDSTTKQVTAAK